MQERSTYYFAKSKFSETQGSKNAPCDAFLINMQTHSLSVQIVEPKYISKTYICVKLTLQDVLCYNKLKKRRPLHSCEAAFKLLSEVFLA